MGLYIYRHLGCGTVSGLRRSQLLFLKCAEHIVKNKPIFNEMEYMYVCIKYIASVFGCLCVYRYICGKDRQAFF